MGKPVKMGSPQGQTVGVGERITMTATPIAHHLPMLLCFYGGLGFFHTFPVVEFLTHIPSGFLFTANSYILLGSVSKTQHPIPFCNKRHMMQAGVCRTVHRYDSVLLSTDKLLHSPSYLIPWSSFSVPGDFLSMGGFFECMNLSSASAPWQRCWSLSVSSSLF